MKHAWHMLCLGVILPGQHHCGSGLQDTMPPLYHMTFQLLLQGTMVSTHTQYNPLRPEKKMKILFKKTPLHSELEGRSDARGHGGVL